MLALFFHGRYRNESNLAKYQPTMNLQLLEMLACPVCHQSLKFEQTKAQKKSKKRHK